MCQNTDSTNNAIFYGYITQSHGWQFVLTVIGINGVGAVSELALVPGLERRAEPGELTRFIEKRGGAIHEFMDRHNVVELDFDAWVAKKRELGEAIY